MAELLRPSLIALVILSAACGKTVEQRLQAIDAMQGVLTNVMVTSDEADDTQINHYLKDVNEKTGRLQAALLTDSLDSEDFRAAKEFEALSNRLLQAQTAKSQIVAMVKESRLKLTDLRTDVQNNLWVEDSLNLYMEIEFQYVMELDEGMNEVIAQVNGCFQTYDQINPRIRELLSEANTR